MTELQNAFIALGMPAGRSGRGRISPVLLVARKAINAIGSGRRPGWEICAICGYEFSALGLQHASSSTGYRLQTTGYHFSPLLLTYLRPSPTIFFTALSVAALEAEDRQ